MCATIQRYEKRAPQFDGRIKEISNPNRDCGKRAAKSSKPDHTGALLPAEAEQVRVASRITIRREQFSSAARGVGLKRGGSRTLVCVLRKRRSVARGGDEGGLAAAAPATSGALRIGRGPADRSLFPTIHRPRRRANSAAKRRS